MSGLVLDPFRMVASLDLLAAADDAVAPGLILIYINSMGSKRPKGRPPYWGGGFPQATAYIPPGAFRLAKTLVRPSPKISRLPSLFVIV